MMRLFGRSGPGARTRETEFKKVKVLLSPFSNDTNAYIEIQKQLFRELGCMVEPLSVASLLRGGVLDVFSRRSIVVLNWLESRPFRWKDGSQRLSLKGSVVFAFYCAILFFGRAKVVYFIHNHAVHDTTSTARKASVFLIDLLCRLAQARVVHAPNAASHYGATYLPHPLYWDVPGKRAQRQMQSNAIPRFGMLGAIRPYKAVHDVLEVWPHGVALNIAGKGAREYVERLRKIVADRSLASFISIEDAFLGESDFERKMSSLDVLVLPHVADSMLVSGAFFEAIGRLPVIVARATPFMKWAAHRYGCVILFEEITELPAIVERLVTEWRPQAMDAVAKAAIDEFGWKACRSRYAKLIESL